MQYKRPLAHWQQIIRYLRLKVSAAYFSPRIVFLFGFYYCYYHWAYFIPLFYLTPIYFVVTQNYLCSVQKCRRGTIGCWCVKQDYTPVRYIRM